MILGDDCSYPDSFLFQKILMIYVRKFCLIIQDKEGANDSKNFDQELVAIIDMVLGYKCNTTTQHKVF